MSVVVQLENHRTRPKTDEEYRAAVQSHVDAIRALTSRYRAEGNEVERVSERLEDAANDLLDLGENKPFAIALRRMED
jgi:hypothetical protein